MKPIKYKRVEVTWIDAAFTDDVELSDFPIKDLYKHMVKRTTAGWLIQKDTKGVVVAVDIQEQGKCDIFAIPTEFKPQIRYV